MFLSPIFVTLLAIPLLGERVGLRRFIGVLIGFIGALIIGHPRVDATAALETVLPVADGIGWLPERGHLLLIGAAVCNASYQIMTRRLRLLDSPMTTLLYSGVVGSLVLSVWVPVVWVAPAPLTWLLLMAVGLLGCVSHFCLIRAFRHAPASLVVPFSYSALLWATLLGYVVFKSLPDHWTLLGALLIISSGLYIFYRESQVQRSS
jgi:drug/metabolite transporter (DMT)-like permease